MVHEFDKAQVLIADLLQAKPMNSGFGMDWPKRLEIIRPLL